MKNTGLLTKAIGFFCLLLFTSHALAFDVKENQSAITVTSKARFTVISSRLIRMEYSDKEIFIDAPSLFAMNRQTRSAEYKLIQDDKTITIDTAFIKITYKPDGNSFSAHNLQGVLTDDHGAQTTWYGGQKPKNNLGGALNSLDHIKSEVPVNDGLLSKDGWFLIDDSTRFIITEQSGKPWVAQRPQGAGLDWYLFSYGHNYKQAFKELTAVSGEVPLPRKYTLGSWYSRWWPYTSTDYRNIAKEFHDHQFPLDMMVMDMDWHKKDSWTGYSWNRNIFPDPEQYLKWLHDQGLHATLNDHPQAGVGPYEDQYAEFMKALDRDSSKKEILPYNTGDAKYLKTVFKVMHDPLEKMGVDFWWLDWMGDSNFVFNRIDWVNELYFHQSEKTGLRGQLFSRWADWGDQRHPIHFSGDSHTDWPTLKFEVPFTASSSNAGVFFWTHDMGGFEGPRNGELLARWTQFGAFSAALRLHSINKAEQDKRPWTYSTRVEDSMRLSFHLRSEFFPYTYSMTWKAHRESLPLIRSLYLEYPERSEAYANSQEYLYGDALLVAPIVQPAKLGDASASQNVWLPEGVWYNWFSHERFVGPQTRTFTHDLMSFPLFAKAAIPLVMQPYTERMGTEQIKTLTIRVFAGDSGSSGTTELYEDDGESKKYLDRHYATTQVSYRRKLNIHEIQVEPTVGEFQGQLSQRQINVELIGVKKAHDVVVNGQAFPVIFDAVTYTNRVTLPEVSVRRKTMVQIVAD